MLSICLVYCSEFLTIIDEDVINIGNRNISLHGNDQNEKLDFMKSEQGVMFQSIESINEGPTILLQNKKNLLSFDEKTKKTYHLLQNVKEYIKPSYFITTFASNDPPIVTDQNFELENDKRTNYLQMRNINIECSTSETQISSCSKKSGTESLSVEKDLSKLYKPEDPNDFVTPKKALSSSDKTVSVKKEKTLKVKLLIKLSRKCQSELQLNKKKLDMIYNLNIDTNDNLPKFNDKIRNEYEKNRLFTKTMFTHLYHNKNHFLEIFEAIERDEVPKIFKTNFLMIKDFFTYIIAGLELREKSNLVYNKHTCIIIEKNKFWIEILALFKKTSIISILTLYNSDVLSLNNNEDIVYHFEQITKKFIVIHRTRKKYLKCFNAMNKYLRDLLKFNS
ncbi:uncharacterized protein VNE69_04216 [Vairimorpha necatrix]|uniref:Uncharacterized protein n=1 Tax=Vairimorpha necatrix TaxID=6039 RepID=A0AAX4JBP8_9MICR